MPGYIGEFSYSNTGGGAFVEIAVPAGTDVSGYTLVVYSSNGRVDATYSFGTSDGSFGGQDVYTVQNEPLGTFPVVGTDAFALVDDLGMSFSLSVKATRDHGPQPIRWIRCGTHPLEHAEVDAKPVQIRAGALGPNRPGRDLIVSPQHCILIGGEGQLKAIFEDAAFAPAKSLTALRGIRHMRGKRQITWVHFACARHEVVTANGCLEPQKPLNGPPARDCLSVSDVKRQLQAHRAQKSRIGTGQKRHWAQGRAPGSDHGARPGMRRNWHAMGSPPWTALLALAGRDLGLTCVAAGTICLAHARL